MLMWSPCVGAAVTDHATHPFPTPQFHNPPSLSSSFLSGHVNYRRLSQRWSWTKRRQKYLAEGKNSNPDLWPYVSNPFSHHPAKYNKLLHAACVSAANPLILAKRNLRPRASGICELRQWQMKAMSRVFMLPSAVRLEKHPGSARGGYPYPAVSVYCLRFVHEYREEDCQDCQIKAKTLSVVTVSVSNLTLISVFNNIFLTYVNNL